MAFRKFPHESKKKERKMINECCKQIANIKEFDCGCSFGCDACSKTHTCKVCGVCYSFDPSKINLHKNNINNEKDLSHSINGRG